MTERSRAASVAAFVLLGWLAGLPVSPASAADEPDLNSFELLTPDDKLATYGIDDPEVDGVSCHFTVPEKGGLKGWIGVAEEVSDISLSIDQEGQLSKLYPLLSILMALALALFEFFFFFQTSGVEETAGPFSPDRLVGSKRRYDSAMQRYRLTPWSTLASA